MKAWGKFSCKQFYSSGSASEAITPVVGSLLMLLILIVLAGAIFGIIFNSVGEDANSQTPMARITVESCKGGLYGVGPTTKRVTLEENKIVLMHEGGDALPLSTTSIKISGYGNSYQGDVGNGGTRVEGDTEVFYENLSPEKKNNTYVSRNSATLEDGFWTIGEKLILCGQDSSKYVNSSVKVSVDGDSNTSDNYGFKADSEILLRIIDSKSRNILVEKRIIVQHAGK